jgi:AcrR family transcriptional regulator
MTEKSSSRGRPRAFDRAAALEAAMIVFWQKGYTAASMSELCAAMGIASPSLYAAFGSKQQLYAEAIRHYGELGASQITNLLDSAPTARGAIESFLLWAAAILTAPGKPQGCMVVLSAVAGEGQPDLGKLVCDQRQDMIQVLQARLDRGIAEGDPDLPAGTDTESLARFYITVHQGMSIQARDGATREQLESTARHALAAWPAPRNSVSPKL